MRRVVGLSLDEAIGRLLAAPSADLVAQVAEGYRTAFLALRQTPDYHEPLFPGARDALTALDQPLMCLGIATGKARRGLDASLARHGLAHHFVTRQTADDNPGKPHPAMLQRAMAETGAAAHETVMIGDTVYDMTMARNAGVRAVGVAWGYHPPEELAAAGAADVIGEFADLVSTLATLDRMFA